DAFDLYHKVQESPEKSLAIFDGPALPALGHALAGSTGAAISNVSTYPLSLIVTRLQIQRQLRNNASASHTDEYKNIRDAAKKIYEGEGGLIGFYVGVVFDTFKTVADSFLFFLAYNFLRQSRIRFSKSSSKHLPVIDELGVGFLAGAFSKFLTTPIANIVTRKQTSSLLPECQAEKEAKQGSLRSIARGIYLTKGLQGFWSGYSASLVLTLNPSLTFLFFESLKRMILPRSKRSNPSTQTTFLLAALSKAIASTITYPFSLAKSRMQSSGAINNKDTSNSELINEKFEQKVPNNVFATVFHIAQTEGVNALYEGLLGEVLKGFFTHGITMVVKEAVHKVVLRLYYTILKLLKRYPSPQELSHLAREQAGPMVADAKGQAQQFINIAKEGVQKLSPKAPNARNDSG
ncbi:MAG: hypothetical protein Q9164_006966, partial [Protoblastenia rupestris]